MSAYQLFQLPKQTNLDSIGVVLPGSKAYFYATGTTTPQDTYSDSGLTTPNSNPVVADSNGVFSAIYLDPTLTYKLTLKTSADVLIYTVDPVNDQLLSQAVIGGYLYPKSDAEDAAIVTITDYSKPYGNVLRYGTNTIPGTTNMTTAIQAAHNQAKQGGARPYLPAGTYLISTAIDPCQIGMYGDGQKLSLMICSSCNNFTIPANAGWDRPGAVFEKCGTRAVGTTCDDKWAFQFPGTNTPSTYNSGFTCRDWEIGIADAAGNGRMGGGFYLKDLFRGVIENVGFTNVSHMVRIVGSVAQLDLRNLAANNDVAGTTLSKYGVSTESYTYTGPVVMTPENIRASGIKYIRGTRGISHESGLLVKFEDFDVEADEYGAYLNDRCVLVGGLFAPGPGATAWVGVYRGVNATLSEDGTIIDKVEINMLRAPGTPSSSYGFDFGNGTNSTYGIWLLNSKVTGGAANSLQSGIRGRVMKDARILNNVVKAGLCLSTEIDIGAEFLCMQGNTVSGGGVISFTDGGASSAFGIVDKNDCTTLTRTFTTRGNWKCEVNGTVISRRTGRNSIADGGTITHGLSSTPTRVMLTPSVSGEFASVTATGATTFTVAIKKHDNSAGTTQDINWEAEF